MDFQEMQKGVLAMADTYSDRFGIAIDENFALLKLCEEMGEFAQAVLIHRKKSKPDKHRPQDESKKLLAEELADIVGLTIINAHLFEIDLEKAITEKWLDRSGVAEKQPTHTRELLPPPCGQ